MAGQVKIACAKCGGPFTGDLSCGKCGGAMAKVCGGCQFQNSMKKNFCDHCQAPLTLSPEAAAAALGPEDPPKTMIRRVEPPKAPAAAPAPSAAPPPVPSPGGFAIPAARSSGQSYTPVPTPAAIPAAPTTTSKRRPAAPSWLAGSLAYVFKSVVSILFLIVVAVAAWLLWLQQAKANSPEVLTLRLSEEYLIVVSRNDYATAHYMLSNDAKVVCPLERFRLMLEPRPWTFSDLKPLPGRPGYAVVEYTRQVQGLPAETAALFWVVDPASGQWSLAYTDNLLAEAEQLLERNNPDIALIRLAAALRVNPWDPSAQADLCRAQKARGAAEAGRDCERAAELANAWPSALSPARAKALRAALGGR